jgi:ppGpp synthetase/RelA/SpoT-type nucleotidyltranferase
MQDIAGCRVVVTDLAEQDRTVAAIEAAFDRVTLLDRRRKPSHGYRAVHLVVRDSGKMVEVQVRTALQHSWAELCEKAADVVDPSVKYGGGPAVVRGFLDRMAEYVKRIEEVESALARAGAGDRTLADELQDVRNEQARLMRALVKYLPESKMESQDDFLDRIR